MIDYKRHEHHDFTGATAVSFGGAPATSYTVDSATSITATAPSEAGAKSSARRSWDE